LKEADFATRTERSWRNTKKFNAKTLLYGEEDAGGDNGLTGVALQGMEHGFPNAVEKEWNEKFSSGRGILGGPKDGCQPSQERPERIDPTGGGGYPTEWDQNKKEKKKGEGVPLVYGKKGAQCGRRGYHP